MYCICAYMCVYIYIYIYICVCVYIYICIHMYTHIFLQVLEYARGVGGRVAALAEVQAGIVDRLNLDIQFTV